MSSPRLVLADSFCPQNESPLFSRLPGELRNHIFALSLTGTSPITDPACPSTDGTTMVADSDHRRLPHLGTQMIRTCRRAYLEISKKALLQNIFRFTTASFAHQFLSGLPDEHRNLIQDVEVDLREMKDANPAVESDWVQYLAWHHYLDIPWAEKTRGLRSMVPHLQTLRFNIEGWRSSETIRCTQTLRNILQGPQGLERVIVTGIDGSSLLFGAKEKYLQEWGPTLFVGVMRFARLAGICKWMADCVRGENAEKVITWRKDGQRLSLEVMTTKEFRSHTGLRRAPSIEPAQLNPYRGSCSMEVYEQRWRSGEWPHARK